MKRLISLVLCLLLVLGISSTVRAEDSGQPVEAAVTDTEPTEDEAEVVDMPVDAVIRQATLPSTTSSIQPIDVRIEMIGDVPYITKTYKLEDTGAEDLAFQLAELYTHPAFQQDGYEFTPHDVYKQVEPAQSETREEIRKSSLEISKNDPALVTSQADPYVDYNIDGYTGRLYLDESTIHIEETGRSNYNYRVEDTREYKNLDRQDAAYIPKTITSEGKELQLENVEWIVMGTTPTADGLIPNLFKAVATYGGSATGSSASGYSASFQYVGTVKKSVPGQTLVCVMFRGEKIVLPEPIPEKSPPSLSFVWVCICAGFIMFAICGLAYANRGKLKQKRLHDSLSTTVEWDKKLMEEDIPQPPKDKSAVTEKIREAAEAKYNDSPVEERVGEIVVEDIENQPLDVFAPLYENTQEADNLEQTDIGEHAGEGYYYGQPSEGFDETKE